MNSPILIILAAIGALAIVFVVWSVLVVRREGLDSLDRVELWDDDEWKKIEVKTGKKTAKK